MKHRPDRTAKQRIISRSLGRGVLATKLVESLEGDVTNIARLLSESQGLSTDAVRARYARSQSALLSSANWGFKSKLQDRAFNRTLEFFDGNMDNAFDWFMHSSPALGGAKPHDHAVTASGAKDVIDLLGRMEHGIPT